MLKDRRIIFNSGLPVLFSSPYYAERLWEVATGRNIEVNLQRNLVEIDPDKKELHFADLKNQGEIIKLDVIMALLVNHFIIILFFSMISCTSRLR